MGFVSYLEDIQESLFDNLVDLKATVKQLERKEPGPRRKEYEEILLKIEAIHAVAENVLREAREWVDMLTLPDSQSGENPYRMIEQVRYQLKMQEREIALLRRGVDQKLSPKILALKKSLQECNREIVKRDQEIVRLGKIIKEQKEDLEFMKEIAKLDMRSVPKER